MNDFITTLYLISLKEYFVKHGDEKSNEILFSTYVNTRDVPTSKGEFTLTNVMTCYRDSFPLMLDFKTALEFVKTKFNTFKNSSDKNLWELYRDLI